MATNSDQGAQGQAFTSKDLWGDDRRPGVDDVEQKRLGDCFLAAAAGEVSLKTPEVIRSGIQFDEKTGNFSVRLFKDGQWSSVAVTQDELKDNISKNGGSSFGSSKAGAGQGLWPAVYEVGYAKMNWGSWEHGLKHIRKGGNPADALRAITGQEPVQLDAESVGTMGMQATAQKINSELADGKRVLMMTRQDPWQPFEKDPSVATFVKGRYDAYQRPGTESDGVSGNHTYMVVGARYDEKTQETYLTLRNPWGHNARLRNPAESIPDPEIEVKIGDLIRDDTRSLNRFEIGQLPEQQRGLFEAIQDKVGPRASDEAIALAAVQASRDGITSASQMRSAGMTEDGKLWVSGNTPGFCTMVDTMAALPPREESMSQLALEAQRLQVANPRIETPAVQRA